MQRPEFWFLHPVLQSPRKRSKSLVMVVEMTAMEPRLGMMNALRTTISEEEAIPGEMEVNDPPEAGHGTSYYVEGSSTSLAKEPAQVPSGNVILPEHESPVATPSEEQSTIVRALSDDTSVVGPFQTVDDVGDHPSCAVDASQEFIKNLKHGTKHVRATFPKFG